MRLEACDLAIGYRGHLVGRDIALSLDPGEVLCLLGPNGAGKTTLFRTLLGLQPPLGGAVTIDGEPLTSMAPAEIARRLAYVPQAHVTEFSYSVLDVVLMGRTARLKAFASPGAADERIALDKLDGLGIRDLASRLHPHFRRPAPARPDRPCARPGGADPGAGRADREPRFRQSGAGARARPRSGARGFRHRAVDPRSRSRASGRDARRRHRRRRPACGRRARRGRDRRDALGDLSHRRAGRGDAVRTSGLRPGVGTNGRPTRSMTQTALEPE